MPPNSRPREPRELIVHPNQPVVQLENYVFVPKGNVYITRNCRKMTHDAHKAVYVVVSATNKVLGLRVPKAIHEHVLAKDLETLKERAIAVQKNDDWRNLKIRTELQKMYPLAPDDAVDQILSHALKKRSGRVGRSTTLDTDVLVEYAVTAYVRHVHTEYEKLLRQGISRPDARSKVNAEIKTILKKWAGDAKSHRSRNRIALSGRVGSRLRNEQLGKKKKKKPRKKKTKNRANQARDQPTTKQKKIKEIKVSTRTSTTSSKQSPGSKSDRNQTKIEFKSIDTWIKSCNAKIKRVLGS